MKKFNEYIKENEEYEEYNSFNDIKNKHNINDSELNLSVDGLKDLNGIEDFKNLKYLWCNDNELVSLEPLKNLIDLRSLYCYNNEIVSLEPLENLINLTKLSCDNNKLESFKGLPENVKYFNGTYNPLNNWQEDIDAFSRSYKLTNDFEKKWFDKQGRFAEIIDLIKINMI